MRRFAENTAVPVARSRGQIDQLLRDWGADAIQWQDDFRNGAVALRFIWSEEPASIHSERYVARIDLKLPDDGELRRESNNTRGFSESRYAKAKANVGKREHRLLLLWLKAVFNAIDQGLMTAETVFLPFFEDKNGRTVAEVALPKMGLLLSGSANRLLPAAREE